MRLQAGVKSIAMGGRPVPSTNTTNASVPIIQAIGGVKGANNDAYSYLTQLATYAYETGTEAQKAQANWTVLTQLMNTLPVNRSTGMFPYARTYVHPSIPHQTFQDRRNMQSSFSQTRKLIKLQTLPSTSAITFSAPTSTMARQHNSSTSQPTAASSTRPP